MKLRFFDKKEEHLKTSSTLPHWAQDFTLVYVTFRTADSIPLHVIESWEREKLEWIRRHGYELLDSIGETIAQMTSRDAFQFSKVFNRKREDVLDECQGRCLLRNPSIASIVSKTLLFFDGIRYEMGDFVIMPNHVHLFAAFEDAGQMKSTFNSWLHYSAREINKFLGERGHFWQYEPFDHLIRSNRQFEYIREYIKNNPIKAKLREGEFLYRRHPTL